MAPTYTCSARDSLSSNAVRERVGDAEPDLQRGESDPPRVKTTFSGRRPLSSRASRSILFLLLLMLLLLLLLLVPVNATSISADTAT